MRGQVLVMDRPACCRQPFGQYTLETSFWQLFPCLSFGRVGSRLHRNDGIRISRIHLIEWCWRYQRRLRIPDAQELMRLFSGPNVWNGIFFVLVLVRSEKRPMWSPLGSDARKTWCDKENDGYFKCQFFGRIKDGILDKSSFPPSTSVSPALLVLPLLFLFFRISR